MYHRNNQSTKKQFELELPQNYCLEINEIKQEKNNNRRLTTLTSFKLIEVTLKYILLMKKTSSVIQFRESFTTIICTAYLNNLLSYILF